MLRPGIYFSESAKKREFWFVCDGWAGWGLLGNISDFGIFLDSNDCTDDNLR
jgi:hypothetical protein